MGACAYHWSGLLECLPIELRPMTRHLEAAVLTLTFQQVITDCAQGLSGGAVATRAAWNLFVGQAAPLTWEGLALLKRKLSQLF